MIKKIVTVVFCCTVFFLSGLFTVQGQNKNVILHDRIITIKADKQPLGKVFKYLMETYDISIGFEQSTLDRNHSEYSFQSNLPSTGSVKMESDDKSIELDVQVEQKFMAKDHPITVNMVNGKLSDVFDQIVSQMANYKWEVNEGVVNIFPVRGRDPRFEELLTTKIDKFELARGNTIKAITFEIMKLKEFQGWLHKNKINFNPARTGSSILLNAQYGRTLNDNMHFSNMSFREVLNNIIKNKKGGWILRWRGVSENGRENIDLDI